MVTDPQPTKDDTLQVSIPLADVREAVRAAGRQLFAPSEQRYGQGGSGFDLVKRHAADWLALNLPGVLPEMIRAEVERQLPHVVRSVIASDLEKVIGKAWKEFKAEGRIGAEAQLLLKQAIKEEGRE